MLQTRRLLSLLIIVCFLSTTMMPVGRSYAATPSVLGLPAPGTMVFSSSAYVPMIMKGVRVHPENPLQFDFIMDTGHSGLTSDTPKLRQESEKLIKYFLATLTIPEQDLWVNLSPYEKDRIIAKDLGQTELGQDMLAQDYMLKQLTASLIYPEKELGKKFWDKVYAQAQQMYGPNVQVPINTFNKVWILPDQAGVFVRNNTAFVVESHLKVMLEEDYLAGKKNNVETKNIASNNVTSQTQIIRSIILPEIEKEVNQGKNFAPLRQIFHSLILASWYKNNLKQALLNQVYSDKSKINGVDVQDKAIKEKIYQQYLAAYKKGVFNYISTGGGSASGGKETNNSNNQQTQPRKYFSGGVSWAMTVATHPGVTTQYVNNGMVTRALSTVDGKVIVVESNFQGTQSRETAEAAMVTRAIEVEHPQLFQERLRTIILKDDYKLRLASEISLATEKKLRVRITPDGEEELAEGVTYVTDAQGGLTINFEDNSYVKYQLEEGNKVSVEADTEDNVVLIKEILKRLVFDDIRLSDYGYNQRVGLGNILKVLNENGWGKLITKYNVTLNNAIRFIKFSDPTVDVPKIHLVNSSVETFGIALINLNGEEILYIEQPFINRINSLENPFNMLTRSIVYALYKGTHHEKRVQEYEYARYTFGDEDLVRRMHNEDLVRTFEFHRDVLYSGKKDKVMADEILTRRKQSLWEIGVHVMNGDMRKVGEAYVRYKKTDRAYDLNKETDKVPVKAGFFGLAANPLHDGQIDFMLREMADFKVDQEAFRVHAYDLRKEATVPTNLFRQEVVAKEIESFLPGRFFYTDLGAQSHLAAEDQVPEFMDEYNGNRPGPLTGVYSIAEDHAHWDAPNNATRDNKGQRKPKSKNGQLEPDTFRRLKVIQDNRREEWRTKRKNLLIVVNGRDPRDGVLMKASDGYAGEESIVKQLEQEGFFVRTTMSNLKNTSSTDVRNKFGLSDNPSAELAYLPNSIADAITGTEGGNYRGFIIGLTDAIGKVASGSTETKPAIIVRNWLKLEIKNNKLPAQFENLKELDFQRIAREFTFLPEFLVKDDEGVQTNLRVELAEILKEKAKKVKLTLTAEEVRKAFQTAWPSSSSAMTMAEVLQAGNGDVTQFLQWLGENGVTPEILDSQEKIEVKESSLLAAKRIDSQGEEVTVRDFTSQMAGDNITVVSFTVGEDDYAVAFEKNDQGNPAQVVKEIKDAIVLSMNPDFDQNELDILQEPDRHNKEEIQKAFKHMRDVVRRSFNNEQLQANMKRIKAGDKLVYRVPLRLYDGSGSSFDLWKFIRRSINEWFNKFNKIIGFRALPTLSATITDIDDIYAEIIFEKGEDGKITYVAPDYFDGERVTEGKNSLNELGRISGGQANATDFVVGQLFGQTGIKVSLKLSKPEIIKAGGLESSNAFNAALFYGMKELTGAKLSHGDLFGIGLVTAQGPLADITGLQGWLAGVFGNIQIFFLGKAMDNQQRLINPRGVILRPLFSNSGDIEKISEHSRLAQVQFEQNEEISRTATLINEFWTFMFDEGDPETVKLEQRKLELAHNYSEALSKGDIDKINKSLEEYAKIRDEIVLRAINLAFDAHEGKAIVDKRAEHLAKQLNELIFVKSKDPKNAFARQFTALRVFYEKGEEARQLLRKQSLYSWGLDQKIMQYAKVHNISIFPLGAGGPGANLLIFAKETAELADFFKKFEARFKNVMKTKIGTKTMHGQWVSKRGTIDSIVINNEKSVDADIDNLSKLNSALRKREAILSRVNSNKTQLSPEGGIDFNKINATTKGDAIDIRFNKAMITQFERGDFSGVRPVITGVQFIPSVLPLLGLAPRREDEENTLAKVGA